MSNRQPSKPSLQALAFMLRNKETWPSNFKWNFSFCENCAIGLAYRTWPSTIPVPTFEYMKRAFGLSEDQARLLFADGYGTCGTCITPAMIADRIDTLIDALSQ
jgi:hypothetical protein